MINQTHTLPKTALIGIGGNLGDMVDTFHQARKILSEHPEVYSLICASLYRSAPVGYTEQPDFLNSVIQISTTLEAHTLLSVLQAIEQHFGRQRPFQYAPRTLDLDILTYGDDIVDSDTLTIPHPQIAYRLFVLKPFLELAPDWVFPNGQRPIDCIQHCQSQVVERIAGSDWVIFPADQ